MLLNIQAFRPVVSLTLEAPIIIAPNPMSKSIDIRLYLLVDFLVPRWQSFEVRQEGRHEVRDIGLQPFQSTRAVELELAHDRGYDVMAV